MGKLLFWIAVIAAVWIAIKFAQSSARRAGGRAGDASKDDRGEPMVKCAHCGVHVPRSESVPAGHLHYCSGAHRDAGPQGR
ncbi:MAG: hypothetical protein KJZ83_08570 [Burkholderiaceae bacterium]|nr:hypothetical protein [Burkholderiaceae bacterium]